MVFHVTNYYPYLIIVIHGCPENLYLCMFVGKTHPIKYSILTRNIIENNIIVSGKFQLFDRMGLTDKHTQIS